MTGSGRSLDAAGAWLILLPAFVLGVPGGPLHDVPTPESAGLGWSLLLALPALGLCALRRRPVRFEGSSLLLFVLAWVVYRASQAGDPFEARRSVLAWSLGFALALAASGLGEAGRRVLARGLPLLTLLYLLGALLTPGGELGNSGRIAAVALPGAAVALVWLPSLRGLPRLLALLAGGGLAFYGGWTPVLTVPFALLCAALATLGSRPRGGAGGLRLLLAALLAAGLFAAKPAAAPAGTAGEEGAPTAEEESTDPGAGESGDLGGIEFRLRTWRAALEGPFRAHPWLGVGPGQFARAFPPYRDPTELALSSHQGGEPTPVEVEHVHNDWLEVWIELGVAGGLAWLLFLGLALRAGLRALGEEDRERRALGVALIASLAAAFLNAPITSGAVAPVVIWPLMGVLLTQERSSAFSRLLPLLATLLLLVRAGDALAFVRHGAALAELRSIATEAPDGSQGLPAGKLAPILGRALAACPDSVVALEKRDELLRATGAPPSEREGILRRILAARPHHLAALQNLGVLRAQAGETVAAAKLLARASELAPTDPAVLRDLLLVSVEGYDETRMLESAQALLALPSPPAGGDQHAWVRELALRLFIAGRPQAGQALLESAAPDLDLTDPDRDYALGRKLDAEGSDALLADAALATANLLWAEQDVERGNFETAVRLFRQALQIARLHPDLPGGDAPLRLEYAAALVLAGKAEEARAALLEGEVRPLHWSHLAAWAGQALLDAGLMEEISAARRTVKGNR